MCSNKNKKCSKIKFIMFIMKKYTGGKMHNLISYNNLKAWTSLNKDPNGADQVTEYFECISDCNAQDRSAIQHCRTLLD